MRGLATCLLLAGCGRVDFSARSDAAADAAVDTLPIDGTGLSYPERVLASGPRVYYRLGESGLPDAFDASGNGSTSKFIASGGSLTFKRPGALTGDPDTAVKTQGRGNLSPISDALVGIEPTLVAWSGDFTVEMFVQPHDRPLESSGYSYAVFVCERYLESGFRVGWQFDDSIRLWTDESGGTGELVSSATIRVDEFNHLAVVHQGGTFTLYLDAVEIASGPVPYVPVGALASCGVGALQGMPSDATFDEVAIYERALSQGEIAAHFSAR